MNTRKKIEKASLAALVIFGIVAAALLGAWAQPRNHDQKQAVLRSTIALVSTRHDPGADPAVDPHRAWLAAEISVDIRTGSGSDRVQVERPYTVSPCSER